METDINSFDNEKMLDHIIKLMKKETNVKVYKKLSFLRFRMIGYSVEEASKFSFISKSYGYKIQDEWFEGGYDKLSPKERKEGSGRKTKLNKRQRQQFSKILKTEKDLTIHKIIDIIKKKWNIEYSYNGVKRLLETYFDVNIEDYLDYNPKSKKEISPSTNPIETSIFNDEEIKEIINYLHGEKDVFVYKKLLSFLFQKMEYSLDTISKIIGISEETLLVWNDQWINNGYDALSRKSGQGRKSKLSDEDWKGIRKIMAKRNDWTLPEIADEIENNYKVSYSLPHLAVLLRDKLKMHFAKPYPKDYRQSPYYKQSFHLKLNHIFKKYKLKYDIDTGNIINMETNEKFHIFSFDEASFQFTPNNVKFWALIKPMVEKDTTIFKCKAMGAYALTPHSKDYLEFVENQKSVTLVNYLENLRNENPEGVILLFIDNFIAHKTDMVFEKAEELNIELCFLPPYSPQLQPIEKIWKDIKRQIASFKINSVKEYKNLTKDERKAKLEEIILETFNDKVKDKNKWNKVLNNFILPKIKLNSPEFNEELVIQKI